MNNIVLSIRLKLKLILGKINNQKLRKLFLYLDNRITNKLIQNRITKYYSNIRDIDIDQDQKQEIEYIKDNGIIRFPYKFTEKYKNLNIEIYIHIYIK